MSCIRTRYSIFYTNITKYSRLPKEYNTLGVIKYAVNNDKLKLKDKILNMNKFNLILEKNHH